MQPPSLRQAFSAIVRNEGLAALWKGNGATIVHRLPYSAINFWAYERLTVHIRIYFNTIMCFVQMTKPALRTSCTPPAMQDLHD